MRLLLLAGWLFGCTNTGKETEEELTCIEEALQEGRPDFFLCSNQVTVLCPNASVGETGVVNGITYTKRDRADIDSLVVAEDWSSIEGDRKH